MVQKYQDQSEKQSAIRFDSKKLLQPREPTEMIRHEIPRGIRPAHLYEFGTAPVFGSGEPGAPGAAAAGAGAFDCAAL